MRGMASILGAASGTEIKGRERERERNEGREKLREKGGRAKRVKTKGVAKREKETKQRYRRF